MSKYARACFRTKRRRSGVEEKSKKEKSSNEGCASDEGLSQTVHGEKSPEVIEVVLAKIVERYSAGRPSDGTSELTWEMAETAGKAPAVPLSLLFEMTDLVIQGPPLALGPLPRPKVWELLCAGFRHSQGLQASVIHDGATCRLSELGDVRDVLSVLVVW